MLDASDTGLDEIYLVAHGLPVTGMCSMCGGVEGRRELLCVPY